MSKRFKMLNSKAEVCLRARPPPRQSLHPVSLRPHEVTRRARREFREEHLGVCTVLVDVGIPIGIVAELVDDEALLASDPQQVEDRILILRDVWPSQAALNRTIQEYPFVLSDQVWTERLPKTSVGLTEMGWSGAEAARMIVERPDCVYLRKFEIHNTLKALQRILGEDKGTDVALRFLARHPDVLLDWRTTLMPKVNRMVDALGCSPKDAANLLVHHEGIFKADVDTMKAAMTLLAEFCGADGAQTAREIIFKAPQILSMTLGRVKDTMRVLQGLGIRAADVVAYPTAFVSRHPYRIVGPRTEYIREHFKDGNLKPTTYLCCSDGIFEKRYVASCGRETAWSAVVAEWRRQSAAAAEYRKIPRMTPDTTKTAAPPETMGIREAKEVASDGQTHRSANMPIQKTAPAPPPKPPQQQQQNQQRKQQRKQQQNKPAQRKPGRFFRKRLTRLQRPANEPNEE